jgi:Helix-turn-helix domain
MTKSQIDQILDALKAGDILTPIDALNRFGCFRLGARIDDLKKLGYDIENLEKSGHHARYILHPAKTIPMPPAYDKPKEKAAQPLFSQAA